ncbi:MAG: hypothetical protein PVF05_03320 [Gemmatimonadales bacterium]|jgi:hypothetical protein
MIHVGRTARRLASSIAVALLLVPPASAAAQESVTGNYEGAVSVAGQQVDFSLTVQAGDDGLEGFMSMPDQGLYNEPLDTVTWQDGALHFDLGVGGGEVVAFDGTRDGDGLSGTLTGPLPEGATWTATRTGDARLASAPTLTVEPASIELVAGQTTDLNVVARDTAGNEVTPDRLRYFVQGERGGLEAGDGRIVAKRGGEYTVLVIAVLGDVQLREDVEATVEWPPIDRIELAGLPEQMQEGNGYRVEPTVLTEGGLVRDDLEPTLRSSNPAVVAVSATGALRAAGPGEATVTASVEGASDSWEVSVRPSPVRTLAVRADRERARTGDVVQVTAEARDERDRALPHAPIAWSVEAFPIDTLIAPPSAAQIDASGRFVAEKPGAYVIHASSGRASAAVEVQVEGRDVAEDVELVGQGAVHDVHTSDLWVWEGVDGRDYAVTGTWGAEGKAYFWDVTDPARITKIDSIQVDARTVNDVKVSEDGRIAVISREGASNRRNGLVIYDVSDPHDVKEVGRYDEGLTGGVHNVFIYDHHVYALSAGQRYDILDIHDPSNPVKVGSFELGTPGHAIHDVWVEDGIAYSSNWRDGVVLVDVGNGIAGGSPDNPVQFARYAYPSGRNHAAFPFRSQSTGKFYVIAGDEIMPGFDPDKPGETRGYLHFIDFTDPDNPREVARYQVPEAGTHNLWVEGDRLYAAFYEGGLRVIDISGDLEGDLYRQGREIARYKAYDPEGKVPNTPMTWGPQPHKGHVFFSDFNSGLWAVKLEPRRELVP